jgi:predicted kinase
MVRLYLSQGRNVVLDRTNFDISQRKTWFDIAREFPSVSVRGMVMGTTTDVSTFLRERRGILMRE